MKSSAGSAPEFHASTNLPNARLVYLADLVKNNLAGCSKSSSSKAAGESKPEAYPQGYVEDFDELRTPLEDFFSVLLEDHSNRRTAQIQRGPVSSIDSRIAIACHRTVFVERRLKRKVDTNRFRFQ